MTQDSYEMNSNRLSRGGSLFGTDPQVQLRTALRTNDYQTFKKLVSYGAVDLEHVYQYPDYKTCLEMAVCDPNKYEFVKLLLQHEVEVNKVNETETMAPIHFAVENGNIEALRALLQDDRIDVNIKSKGNNTALLTAIKKIEDLEDNREDDLAIYEDMIELLLKAGCNSGAPDLKGITPIHSAAKQGLERVITLILDYAKEPVDLDTYKDIRGKNARHYLRQAFPHLLPKFDTLTDFAESIDNDKLFNYLSRHDEENFVRDFTKLVRKNEHKSVLATNNGTNTMLQFASEKGLEKVVYILLNSGADPNATCTGNSIRPVAIACANGYHKILQMFLDNENTLFDPINDDSLIQITVKGMRSYTTNNKSDFKECLELLLNHSKTNINVNHLDLKDNTALHYAARSGDNDIVLELLRHGACVSLRNKFNEPPLADINAKTLETYLDECVTSNEQRPTDDDYEIRMKYSFLVYPNNSLENELCKIPLMDNSNNNNSLKKECDSILAPETDALLYMTRSEELRPLLKHPVITSFLFLKWQRISCLFYANITFYSLLWLCLIMYIILGYGVEKKQSDSIEMLNIVTHVGAIIGLILLIFRELFQLLVSPIRYLQSIENWMEIALIFVTAWIVCKDTAEESTKQQLSAVAILLSSAELVLLIGQFPTLSTNIVMLKTVSWNFFKFLLWYCILIIAFALSFYTLFRKVADDDQIAPNPNNTGNEDEEENFFEDPGRSLFKTIVMLTGEFDAGSIKFSTFPGTSHLIFIVFVFMVPIVLFNLLNGLAVSDTQEIRADAELVGHISRIKLISYFESVLIGGSKSYGKPWACWSWLPSQLQDLRIIKPKMLCISPLAKRISLFPHFLPKYRIVVKPNQNNTIEIPHAESIGKFGDDDDDVESGGCCFERCQHYRLDRKIVKNAKLVISKKTTVTEFDEIMEKLNKYESKIENLETTLKKILDTVEYRKH